MTKEENYINKRRKVIERKIVSYNVKNNENLEVASNTSAFFDSLTSSNICSTCSECCCAVFPCIYSPHDFLNITNIEYMSSILDLGLFCIAPSFNKRHLIIRPRGYNDSPKIVSLASHYVHNKCILLSETGCVLPPAYRPCEGLLYLAVDNEYDHIVAYTEEDMEIEYKGYQDSIRALYNNYFDKQIPIQKPNNEQIRALTRKLAGYK